MRLARLEEARLYFVCEGLPGGRRPGSAARRGPPRRRGHRPAAGEVPALATRSWSPSPTPSGARPPSTERCSSSTTGPTWSRPARPTASTWARTTCRWPRRVRLAGPEALVGLSTHSPEQIEAACAAAGDDRPDQISVGPVWETPTKEGRPGTGLGLIELRRRRGDDPLVRDRRDRRRQRRRGRRPPAPSGSSSCGRSATPRIPRPPRAACARRSRRGVGAAAADGQPRAQAGASAASARRARVERRSQIAARYEERNRAAREALEPLARGERPLVVTVGAVISGLIAALGRGRLPGRAPR